ncbi:hypothetical protein B7755_011800 [Streptomyces sp. NBS 14/10]|uniref:hypothetical protein n=1 Tax=Streptomyces sp. NBS 14/10 TaxID=1945643 RepID=UPI00117F788C|nr:hypothetical protein [Streptomyces sp. NBS 14/10]KAK1178760.1 hypothetical protein B7755_011800 [Streptomyces sp. NBS 14/10]
MPLFANRRKPHLSSALDDTELGRVVKSLREVARPGLIGTTDLHVARIANLMQQPGVDWGRRAHRLAVLAEATVGSDVPSAWIARAPRSADAMLLYAWTELVRGRWSGGMRDAPATLRTCYDAADLDPGDPNPWAVALGVARLERYDRHNVLAIWREVTARDPQHREAHLQMLGYLSPEEGGSRMQVLEFIDSVRARTPANAPTAGLGLAAVVGQHRSIVAKGHLEALMVRDFWTRPPVAKVLDEAGEMWPQPGFLRHARTMADLNLLAYALVTAERGQQAARVFPLLEGKVTAWPWELRGDPVEAFLDAQARSVR